MGRLLDRAPMQSILHREGARAAKSQRTPPQFLRMPLSLVGQSHGRGFPLGGRPKTHWGVFQLERGVFYMEGGLFSLEGGVCHLEGGIFHLE